MVAAIAERKIKTASNLVARRAWRLAEADGMSLAAFSRATGLSESDLQRPGGRIDGNRHRRVILLLDTLLPKTPYQLSNHLAAFPDLGALWCNSPSLRSAFSGYLHYRHVLGEFDEVRWQADAHRCWFEYVPETQGPEAAINARYNLQVLLHMVLHYAAQYPYSMVLEIPGARDAAWDAAVRDQPILLHTHAGRFALGVRSLALDAPYACHNPFLYRHSCSQLDSELSLLRQPVMKFSARVSQVLQQVLSADDVASGSEGLLDKVCARLHMSRWTLQRHLQDEALDFTALLQQMRLAEARRLLCETEMPLSQISEQLGFCSQSTFTRFFSRQFGQSPARFRQEGSARS